MRSPRLLIVFLSLSAAGTPGCTGDGGVASGGGAISCSASAPTSCPDLAPHYTTDIQPIIEQNCASPCHSGVTGGPWPLNSYEHVADWADAIRSDLLDCEMPPADGGVTLSDDDRLAILTWIRCGYPE